MVLYHSDSVMIRVWTFSTHRYSFGFVCDKCSENTNISDNTSIGWMFACNFGSHNRNHYSCILVKTVNSVRNV